MSPFTGKGFEATVYVTRHGRPIGTGFLLGIPDDPDATDLRNSATYVVTARHVVTNREGLAVRLNGMAGLVEADAADWWDSEDDSADVSVAYLPPSPRYGRRAFGVSMGVDARSDWVGTGTEVATIGLFSKAPGEERNHPIVRFRSHLSHESRAGTGRASWGEVRPRRNHG